MRYFVIRPFGTKEGIDFERVDAELIQPALGQLAQLGVPVAGGTTGQISRQGNIREDMFRLIVVADLVIADVSIHNANVFYELGIRHALRPRHTFLIRSATDHAYPFDLQTDRYFLYDAADPGIRVDALARALRASIASDERDSPVFSLLPTLAPHPRAQLVKVPTDFQQDVERAAGAGRRGDLRLFAHEVTACVWAQEGLRLIGDAQLSLRAFAGARDTYELLRSAARDDVHANLRLGTIYQRLSVHQEAKARRALLMQSDQAIRAALADSPAIADKAEACSLLGSNEKSRWIDAFMAAPLEQRAAVALGSPHLRKMLEHYLKAANQDLNAHYPALNALAFINVQINLAGRLPDAWQDTFDDDARAAAELKSKEKLAARLNASLCLALGMDAVMGAREGDDRWAASSRAEFLLMNACDRPARAVAEYRRALLGADRFQLGATRRNLGIFQEFGLFEPGVSAVLAIIDEAIAASDPAQPVPRRIIVFAGHMVDAPGQAQDKARFLRTEAAAATARQLIFDAVQKEVADDPAGTVGIAGGACGGDILFHEVCQELGVQSQLFLALPNDQFEVKSVQRGDADWVERYRALTGRLETRVLQKSEALPGWLTDKPDGYLWQRNNLWMIFSALAMGARELTLVSLWNPDRTPNGAGGTADMVREASARGFKHRALDGRALLAAV